MQQAKNILWNEPPVKPIAQFLSSGSRAVVETPDGRVFSYDNTRPRGQRFVEEKLGFHFGHWMQPSLSRQIGTPIRLGYPGDYPFAEFEDYLELQTRVYRSIRFFLLSLDPEIDAPERVTMARMSAEIMSGSDVRGSVIQPVLLENPIPIEYEPLFVRLVAKQKDHLK